MDRAKLPQPKQPRITTNKREHGISAHSRESAVEKDFAVLILNLPRPFSQPKMSLTLCQISANFSRKNSMAIGDMPPLSFITSLILNFTSTAK